MSEENDIKIGPPQNDDFLEIWDGLNNFVEKLVQSSNKIPKPNDLKSDELINQKETIGEISKEIKNLEEELNNLIEKGITFLGKPNFTFKKDVDVRLSTSNYLNLLSLRISYAEKNYLQTVYDIQRIEDFIQKHNSNLRAERSLRYGRVSIALGIFGILLGIVSSFYNLIQPSNSQSNNQIREGIIEPELNSSYVDSIKKKPDTSIVETDTISNN